MASLKKLNLVGALLMGCMPLVATDPLVAVSVAADAQAVKADNGTAASSADHVLVKKQITQDDVAAASKLYAKEVKTFKSRRVWVGAAATGLATFGAYGVYKYLNQLFMPSTDVKELSSEVTALRKEVGLANNYMNVLEGKLTKEQKQSVSELYHNSWKAWFVSLGSSSLSFLLYTIPSVIVLGSVQQAMVAMVGKGSTVFDRYFPVNSIFDEKPALEWYIKNRTHFESNIEHLSTVVQYPQLFSEAAQAMIDDVIRILGYIEYCRVACENRGETHLAASYQQRITALMVITNSLLAQAEKMNPYQRADSLHKISAIIASFLKIV